MGTLGTYIFNNLYYLQDIFCPKHTNCEDPILVIAEILSELSPVK